MKTIKALSNLIQRYTNGLTLVVMFVLFFLVASPMRYSSIGEYRIKEMNHGEEILDMRSEGYSAIQAYDMLETIGAAGRTTYMQMLGLDVIFAIVYMLLQSILITYLLQKMGVRSQWMLLNLLPFVRTGLDLLENGLILMMIVSFPAQLPFVAGLSSTATILKMMIYTGIIALVAFLGVLAILTLVKNLAGKLFRSQSKYTDEQA